MNVNVGKQGKADHEGRPALCETVRSPHIEPTDFFRPLPRESEPYLLIRRDGGCDSYEERGRRLFLL